MSYSIVRDAATFEAAKKLARGKYQLALLDGYEALSGATLKGKAKRYGDVYARSAANLLSRCQAAGLNVREERREHGKRVLVIG